MSDRVHIPFAEDIEQRCIDKPEGAAWGWFSHPFYDQLVPWLYCPVCKNSAGILTRHSLATDGEVNASIMCNTGENCTWHIWGILDEFAEHGGVARPPLK
jgi:hypothetical protein